MVGREFNFHVVMESVPVPEDANFVICNYDKLTNKEVLDSLLERNFDLLVVDEAHKLKNPKTQRTQTVLGYWDVEADVFTPGLVHTCTKTMFLTRDSILNNLAKFIRFSRRWIGRPQLA
jgi:hypothetical protein